MTEPKFSGFLGDRVVKILEAVDRVEIFRIEPRWEKNVGQDASFAGYRLTGNRRGTGKNICVATRRGAKG